MCIWRLRKEFIYGLKSAASCQSLRQVVQEASKESSISGFGIDPAIVDLCGIGLRGGSSWKKVSPFAFSGSFMSLSSHSSGAFTSSRDFRRLSLARWWFSRGSGSIHWILAIFPWQIVDTGQATNSGCQLLAACLQFLSAHKVGPISTFHSLLDVLLRVTDLLWFRSLRDSTRFVSPSGPLPFCRSLPTAWPPLYVAPTARLVDV